MSLQTRLSALITGIKGEFTTLANRVTVVEGAAASYSGAASLDFGTGSNYASTIISNSDVLSSHQLTVELSIVPTADHPLEDLLYDPIRVTSHSIVDGVGFTVLGHMDNSAAHGTYNINWYAR